jgi:hypothetical protein
MKEVLDSLFFVVFPDCSGSAPKTFEGTEEPSVGLVMPAHVTRAAPPVLTKGVKTAVIADAERGIAFDFVAAELAQAGPGVEKTWVVGDNGGDRGAAVIRRNGKGLFECGQPFCRFCCQNGFGRTGTCEINLLAHSSMLPMSTTSGLVPAY